jgi:predicted small secreted protein
MRPTLLAPFVALAALVLAGCSTTTSCGGDDKYQKAQERPKLDLPPGVFGSERMQPIVIPPASPDPQKLDPEPQCLDYPPQYFAQKSPAQGSAEASVRAWGAAWAERKPDTVLQAYATDFQAPGSAGASAFLTEREEQVATGPAASPVLEDMTVTVVGDDRRIVTFTQTVGDQKIRRELTLQRDGQTWRIVAERTLGAP